VTLLLAVTAACRFTGDACLMLLFGGCGLGAVAGPAAARAVCAPCLRCAGRAAALIAFLALLALLPLQAAAVGNGWSSLGDASLTWIVFWKTGFGQAWGLRAVVLALLAVLVCVRFRLGPVAFLAGLGLALTALTGHAAMHEGWLGIFHHGLQALHVLCAGAWVGALPAVPGLLRQLGTAGERDVAVHSLRRFSRLGHVAVAGVLITGAANTLLVVGAWPVRWSVTYQMLLGIKIMLAMCMVLLAVVNRYVWVPRLAQDPEMAIAAIRRGTWVEIAVAVLVLGLVAVLGLLQPV